MRVRGSWEPSGNPRLTLRRGVRRRVLGGRLSQTRDWAERKIGLILTLNCRWTTNGQNVGSYASSFSTSLKMMFANAGVIYKALGIPVNSFTVMFAMGLRGHVAIRHDDLPHRCGEPLQLRQVSEHVRDRVVDLVGHRREGRA